MSRHLNGWHPTHCYYCGGKFGANLAKYLRFVTRTAWIYLCGECKESNQEAIRAPLGHDLTKKVSNHVRF